MHKMTFPVMAMRLREVGEISGLAAAYVIAARLGLPFDAVAGFATLVWPPTLIAIGNALEGVAGAWLRVELARLAGLIPLWGGAWLRRPAVIVLGVVLIVACWLWGLRLPRSADAAV